MIKLAVAPKDQWAEIEVYHNGKYHPRYFRKDEYSAKYFRSGFNSSAVADGRAPTEHIKDLKGKPYFMDIKNWLKGRVKSKQLKGQKYGKPTD